MPRVSVLLCYRDAGATLEAALRGVLEPTDALLEVIAVDDGSRDGGGEIARSIDDPRLRHARTDGVGVVGAMAVALDRCRGELVGRMDADDVSLPGRIEAQAEALTADPSLGAVGARVRLDEAAGEGLRRYVEWQNGLVSPEDHAREIFVEAPLCNPSTTVRRAALDAVGGYRDGPFPEDYDLWLRLWDAGFGLAKVPRVLLEWRHSPGRLTFRDPRYSLDGLRRAKAPFLARRLEALGTEPVVWGAGATGKRLARELEPHGVRARRFVDIDPRKIGRRARGAPIVGPDALGAPGEQCVVVAVGARGARQRVREHLTALGHREGVDFICAA